MHRHSSGSKVEEECSSKGRVSFKDLGEGRVSSLGLLKPKTLKVLRVESKWDFSYFVEYCNKKLYLLSWMFSLSLKVYWGIIGIR